MEAKKELRSAEVAIKKVVTIRVRAKKVADAIKEAASKKQAKAKAKVNEQPPLSFLSPVAKKKEASGDPKSPPPTDVEVEEVKDVGAVEDMEDVEDVEDVDFTEYPKPSKHELEDQYLVACAMHALERWLSVLETNGMRLRESAELLPVIQNAYDPPLEDEPDKAVVQLLMDAEMTKLKDVPATAQVMENYVVKASGDMPSAIERAMLRRKATDLFKGARAWMLANPHPDAIARDEKQNSEKQANREDAAQAKAVAAAKAAGKAAREETEKAEKAEKKLNFGRWFSDKNIPDPELTPSELEDL
jgi:hypothetical protein